MPYLCCFDGVVLVVHWRGRARHVVDLVYLCPEGLGDVMPHELEVGPVEQVLQRYIQADRRLFKAGAAKAGTTREFSGVLRSS